MIRFLNIVELSVLEKVTFLEEKPGT